MPKPNSGESQKAYISRCISYVMKKEGVSAKQAAGKCHGMWRQARKVRPKLVEEEIKRRIRKGSR